MGLQRPLSSNYWDTSSRYNAIHISKKIIPIIHTLIEAELLDVAKASYSGPLARGNRTTRIRASEVLQGWFAEVAFRRDDVGRVIDYTRVGELKQVMAAASEEVAGAPLPTSNQFYGLDEQADPNAEHVKDYVIWRQTARSEGYLQRLAEHERRTGREVVPFLVNS